MELSTIMAPAAYYLIGMNFYGNPFNRASAWEEENEIGVLCRRFGDFYQQNAERIKHNLFPEAIFEGHFVTEETQRTGNFDVFVGVIVDKLEEIPIECVARQLPHTAYAVITIHGKEISTDWQMKIFNEWLPGQLYAASASYSLTRYDQRFLGMDLLEASEIDVYIPVKPVHQEND
jgi:predicted transcriptional regulator YdeE